MLGLMATHFIQTDQLIFSLNYEYNNKLIVKLKNFLQIIFECFRFTENGTKLTVHNLYPDTFKEMQETFDDLSHQLKVPDNYFAHIKFKRFFEEFGHQFEYLKGEINNDDETVLQNETQKLYKKTSLEENKLNELQNVLKSTLNEANELVPPPQALIKKLKILLKKIRDFDECTIKINELNSEKNMILSEFEDYKKKIETLDYFSLLLVNLNIDLEITVLKTDHFQEKKNENVETDLLKIEGKLGDLKEFKNQTVGDIIRDNISPYKTLLRRNTKLMVWKKLLQKISTLNYSGSIECLLDEVEVLSDELYSKLKNLQKSVLLEDLDRTAILIIFKYYGFFRLKIFEETSFFNNFEYTQNLCKLASEKLNTENISLINVHDILGNFAKLGTAIQYELKNYPGKTSFALLPFYIEYVDLLSTMFPHHSKGIQYLFGIESNLTDANFNYSECTETSFLSKKSVEDLTRIVIEISRDNLKKRKENPNINFDITSPNYQLFLSFFGLVTTCLRFCSCNYKSYIENKMVIKVPSQSKLIEQESQIGKIKESIQKIKNFKCEISRKIKSKEEEINSIELNSKSIGENYTQLRGDIKKLDEDLVNSKNELDREESNLTQANLYHESLVTEIHNSRMGIISNVKMQLSSIIRSVDGEVNKLVNAFSLIFGIKSDNYINDEINIQSKFFVYTEYLKDIFLKIINRKEQINVEINSIEITKCISAFTNIQERYDLNCYDELLIELTKIQDLAKTYEHSLKNSIKNLSNFNNLTNKQLLEKQSIEINKRKTNLKPKFEKLISFGSDKSEINKLSNSIADDIKELENLRINNLNEKIIKNSNNFIMRLTNYFKSLLKSTLTIYLNESKMTKFDFKILKDLSQDIPIDSIELAEFHSNLLVQFESVFSCFENYLIEIIYDYPTNPFQYIQDFNDLLVKYDEPVLRLILVSKKLLDHFINLFECFLKFKEFVTIEEIKSALEFISNFMKLLRDFRGLISGDFYNSELFINLITTYRKHCLTMAKKHQKMLFKDKGSDKVSIIDQLVKIGKILFTDIYRIMNRNLRLNLEQTINKNANLVSKYNGRFDEFWKINKEINWECFENRDFYDLNEIKCLIINCRPSHVKTQDIIKKNSEMVENMYLMMNLTFEGFLKHINDFCAIFQENYFLINNSSLSLSCIKKTAKDLEDILMHKASDPILDFEINDLIYDKQKWLTSIFNLEETSFDNIILEIESLQPLTKKINDVKDQWNKEWDQVLSIRDKKRKVEADEIKSKVIDCPKKHKKLENIKEKYERKKANFSRLINDTMRLMWQNKKNNSNYQFDEDLKKFKNIVDSNKKVTNDLAEIFSSVFNQYCKMESNFNGTKFKLKELTDLNDSEITRKVILRINDDEFFRKNKIKIFSSESNSENEFCKYNIQKKNVLLKDNQLKIKLKMFTLSNCLVGESDILKISDLMKNKSTHQIPIKINQTDIVVSLNTFYSVNNYKDLLSENERKKRIQNLIEKTKNIIKNMKLPPQLNDCKCNINLEEYNEESIKRDFNKDREFLNKRNDHEFIDCLSLVFSNMKFDQELFEIKNIKETKLKIEAVKNKLKDIHNHVNKLNSLDKGNDNKRNIQFNSNVTLNDPIDLIETETTEALLEEAKNIYIQIMSKIKVLFIEVIKYLQNKFCIYCLHVENKTDLENAKSSLDTLSSFYNDTEFINMPGGQQLYNESYLLFRSIERFASYLSDYKKKQIDLLEHLIDFSCRFENLVNSNFNLPRIFSSMPPLSLTYLAIKEESTYISASSFSLKIDFGTVWLTGAVETVKHVLHIINHSTIDVKFKFNKPNDYNEIFEISCAPEITIPANNESSVNFLINLNHQILGSHETHLNIRSDRLLENDTEKTIKLKLEVQIEKLDVKLSRNAIDFGSVLENKTLKEKFLVTNETGLVIYLQSKIEISSQLNVRLNKENFLIKPFSSEEIAIYVTTSSLGSFDGSIILNLNSSIKKVVKFKVNVIEPSIVVINENDKKTLEDGSSVTLDQTELDCKISLSLKVQNTSQIRVFIHAAIESLNKNAFKLDKEYFSIVPNKSEYIRVELNGEKEGELKSILKLNYGFKTTIKHVIHLVGTVGIKEVIPLKNIPFDFNTIDELKEKLNNGVLTFENYLGAIDAGKNTMPTNIKIKGSEVILESDWKSLKSKEPLNLPKIEFKLLKIDDTSETLTILNESKKQPSFTIPFHVSFRKPKMILEPLGAILIGNVHKDQKIKKKFEFSIQNIGKAELKYNLSLDQLNSENVIITDINNKKVNLNEESGLSFQESKTHKLKIEIKSEDGIFFHQICIESESDPYYCSTGTLFKKRRYLALYGSFSDEAAEQPAQVRSFNWKSCNNKSILESSLVESDETIFTTWPSLILAMMIENKSYKLPENENDYKDILSNPIIIDTAKLKTPNELSNMIKIEKKGISSNMQSYFKCSKMIIKEENLYLYECFYFYFGSLVHNDTLRTNNLVCLLINTLNSKEINFEVTSLHEFSEKLDKEVLNNDACEPNLQKLIRTLDILPSTDIVLNFHLKHFVALIQSGLNLERKKEFEIKLLELIRESKNFENICKLIEEKNIEYFLSLMKNTFKNLLRHMDTDCVNKSTMCLVETLPTNIISKIIKNFLDAVIKIWDSNKLTENCFNIIFSSIINDPNLKNLNLLFKIYDKQDDAFSHILSLTLSIAPQSIKSDLENLQSLFNAKSAQKTCEINWNSYTLFSNVSDKSLLKLLQQLYDEKSEPLKFVKKIKEILAIVCGSNSAEIKKCNSLLDSLLEFLESNINNSVENSIVEMINFLSILTNNEQKWSLLSKAFAEYFQNHNLTTSLNLIYQYLNLLERKSENFENKVELLQILEHFQTSATENISTATKTKMGNLNFIFDCFLDFSISKKLKAFFNDFESRDSILSIKLVSDLADLLIESSQIFKVMFDKELLEISKKCLNSSQSLNEIKVLNNKNLKIVIDLIKEITSIFKIKYPRKKELFDLASDCLNALTCLLCNKHLLVNRASCLICLFISLMKLFCNVPTSTESDTEKTNEEDENKELSFSFIKQQMNKIPEIKALEINNENQDSIKISTQQSSCNFGFITLTEQPNLEKKTEGIVENLKTNLNNIMKLVAFESTDTLDALNSKKINSMITAVPKLRCCVIEWQQLFINLFSLNKNNIKNNFDKICKDAFEVSMNLLRFMLTVQLTLKQYLISDKPIKNLNDDIEQLKKYLAYLGNDSCEIFNLFKKPRKKKNVCFNAFLRHLKRYRFNAFLSIFLLKAI